MGLLAQLFRHKNASHASRSVLRRSAAGGGGVPASAGAEVGEVRGLGAIAAAVGVRPERGVPAEFELSLGELLHRVPSRFIWPGKHDANRNVRIPAAEVGPGLARGRVELSLARLVALAPDVFRWERGESEEPRVRLPIQKLLQQIGEHPSEPAARQDRPAKEDAMPESRTPSVDARAADFETAAADEIVTAHLPSIHWDKAATPDVAAAQTAVAPAETPAPAKRESSVAQEAPPIPQAVTVPPETKPPAPTAATVPPPPTVASADQVLRPVELRPTNDVSVSATLRAVVLGGNTSGSSLASSAPAGRILAPRSAVPAATPPVTLAPADARPSIVPTAAGGVPTVDYAQLQSLFMTGMPLDLAGVAALTAALPGVHACVISGAAGSAEAGKMPPGLNPAEVRAASAEFARKIGGVESTTIHRGDSAIAIFTRGGVCLSAVIDSAGFVPGVRERLLRVSALLAGEPSSH